MLGLGNEGIFRDFRRFLHRAGLPTPPWLGLGNEGISMDFSIISIFCTKDLTRPAEPLPRRDCPQMAQITPMEEKRVRMGIMGMNRELGNGSFDLE